MPGAIEVEGRRANNSHSWDGGHGWDDWRLAARCGVLFAEPLPLVLPFLRGMRACYEAVSRV
jgi:hypothetical protein